MPSLIVYVLITGQHGARGRTGCCIYDYREQAQCNQACNVVSVLTQILKTLNNSLYYKRNSESLYL